MKTTTFILAGLVVLGTTTRGRGEQYGTITSQPTNITVYDHASTAAEGFLRGEADLERANGAFLLNQSQAGVNWQEARRRDIENRQAAVKAYFAVRAENRRARLAEKGERVVATPRPQAIPVARKFVNPLGLNHSIEWPSVLESQSYAAYRLQLETMAAKHAGGQPLSRNEYQALLKVRQAMTSDLQHNVCQLKGQEYATGAQFIRDVCDAIRLIGDNAQLAGK